MRIPWARGAGSTNKRKAKRAAEDLAGPRRDQRPPGTAALRGAAGWQAQIEMDEVENETTCDFSAPPDLHRLVRVDGEWRRLLAVALLAFALTACGDVRRCERFCAPRHGVDLARTLALYESDPGPEWCACRDGSEVDLDARGSAA